MPDREDFSVLASIGSATEDEAGYSRPFVFSAEKVIAASGSGSHVFTITDPYFAYIPLLVAISTQGVYAFTATVYFAGVEFFYAAADRSLCLQCAALTGLQLENADTIQISLTNLSASQVTFLIAVQGAKLLMSVGG